VRAGGVSLAGRLKYEFDEIVGLAPDCYGIGDKRLERRRDELLPAAINGIAAFLQSALLDIEKLVPDIGCVCHYRSSSKGSLDSFM
jgi:hypothetical protein